MVKKEKTELNDSIMFPIVGIGASAGGLEALKNFMSNTPTDMGVGFVIIQHLDPSHKSSMAEILQKYTSMKVSQVKDGMTVEPNQVYVIPPDRDMGIINGTLQLLEPSEPHGLRTPINFFLKNLAEDQKDNAIAVILSGYGSDGSIGLKYIKTEGGLAIAQAPETAGSSGMPQNAIKTGLIDITSPPDEMPKKILSYIRSSRKNIPKITLPDRNIEQKLQKIFIIIRTKTGHDFSSYKESTINRRIVKRMNIHQIDNIPDYVNYLQENPTEIDLLFNELLINVTSFFRDKKAFEFLEKNVLPKLLSSKSQGETIRIWVPGCSSGEEVYSLAIIFLETMELLKKHFEIQIFGTDIDRAAIEQARKAVYPASISADVSSERLKKFFIQKDDKYVINSAIREMVVFAVHNVLKDPPFAKLDLISCRNLLIYLKGDAQKKLLPVFNYALNSGGILFLAPSESIGEYTEAFSTLDRKWKIFENRKTISVNVLKFVEPLDMHRTYPEIETNFKELNNVKKREITSLAKKNLLNIYAPPSVLINDSGEILYIHGKIGKYLELAPGKPRLNIVDMGKDGGFEIGAAIRSAASEKKDVVLEKLQLKNGKEDILVNITVEPIKEPGINQGLLMVSFEDVKNKKGKKDEIIVDASSKSDKRVKELESDLKVTKDRLNTTIEKMKTSYEELKAANEELQSMNEESQSSNEELETSKEELQSINEELATVNSELQNKVIELTRVNDDMNNLFNSTEIATIFLDKDLNIRNFTPEASKIINLIQSDIGRPLSHIASNIKYDRLDDDIKDVINRLVFVEREVETKDGKWYLMRINPYKTSEDRIDGAVISFIDIEKRVKYQKMIEGALEYSESIIDTLREPLLVLDNDFKVMSANKSFYNKFKVPEKETVGSCLFDLGDNQWDIPALRDLLEKILPENTEFNDFEVNHNFPKIGEKKMLLNARKIYRKDVGKEMILLAIEDINNSS